MGVRGATDTRNHQEEISVIIQKKTHLKIQKHLSISMLLGGIVNAYILALLTDSNKVTNLSDKRISIPDKFLQEVATPECSRPTDPMLLAIEEADEENEIEARGKWANCKYHSGSHDAAACEPQYILWQKAVTKTRQTQEALAKERRKQQKACEEARQLDDKKKEKHFVNAPFNRSHPGRALSQGKWR